MQDKKNDPDALKKLVMEVVPDKSCLVFCPTKKNCENVALLICRGMDKYRLASKKIPRDEHLIFSRSMLEVYKQDRFALYRALKEEGGGIVCDILKRTIPFGVAYHHSGTNTCTWIVCDLLIFFFRLNIK